MKAPILTGRIKYSGNFSVSSGIGHCERSDLFNNAKIASPAYVAALFTLTHNSIFPILTTPKSNFLSNVSKDDPEPSHKS